MKKQNYLAPQIGVIQIEVENAILSASSKTTETTTEEVDYGGSMFQ